MRWDRLFADLEARFDELGDADAAAEQADRDRVAAGAVTWLQRLGGAVDRPVRLRLATGAVVSGTLRRIGPDVALIDDGLAGEFVVPLRAVVAVEGLTSSTGQALSGVAARLDLRLLLRGIARDRSAVALTTAGAAAGSGTDGAPSAAAQAEITGTIDRVGADFLELAVHAAWEPRRATGVRSVVLVPLVAVVLIRAVPLG